MTLSSLCNYSIWVNSFASDVSRVFQPWISYHFKQWWMDLPLFEVAWKSAINISFGLNNHILIRNHSHRFHIPMYLIKVAEVYRFTMVIYKWEICTIMLYIYIYIFRKKEILLNPQRNKTKRQRPRPLNSRNKGSQPGTRPHSKHMPF